MQFIPLDPSIPHSLTRDCACLFVEYFAYALSIAMLPFNTIIDESCIVDTATRITTLIETGRFQLLYIFFSNTQHLDY